MIVVVVERIATHSHDFIFNTYYVLCVLSNGGSQKTMNVFEFIVAIVFLACVILYLIYTLHNGNNIKELDLQLSPNTGIKIKTFFYKKK